MSVRVVSDEMNKFGRREIIMECDYHFKLAEVDQQEKKLRQVKLKRFLSSKVNGENKK